MAGALLLVAACSPEEAEPTSQPTSEPTPEQSAEGEPEPSDDLASEPEPSDEPEPEPEPTEELDVYEFPDDHDEWLSEWENGRAFEFDDDPRIAAAELWRIEYAISVNHDDFDRPEWLATMTEETAENRDVYYQSDQGRFLPGPTSVVIVDTYEADGGFHIQLCAGLGYSVERDDHAEELVIPSASDLDVDAQVTRVVELDGEYVVDGNSLSEHSCDGVEPEPQTW